MSSFYVCRNVHRVHVFLLVFVHHVDGEIKVCSIVGLELGNVFDVNGRLDVHHKVTVCKFSRTFRCGLLDEVRSDSQVETVHVIVLSRVD